MYPNNPLVFFVDEARIVNFFIKSIIDNPMFKSLKYSKSVPTSKPVLFVLYPKAANHLFL